MRRQAVPMAALAATVTMALAGCGSRVATRAGVIARADAACQSAQSSIRALVPPADGSAAALASYLTRLQPIVAREARTIEELPRPQRQQATLVAFQTAIGRVDKEYGVATRAARSGDGAGLSAAFAALRASPVAALARAYGMRVCAGGTPTVG